MSYMFFFFTLALIYFVVDCMPQVTDLEDGGKYPLRIIQKLLQWHCSIKELKCDENNEGAGKSTQNSIK